MTKLARIRKLYERAVTQENAFLEVHDRATNEMGKLKDVMLVQLQLATMEVETLKKVLNILEEKG